MSDSISHEPDKLPAEDGWPSEAELEHPTVFTIARIVKLSVWRAIKERPGQIILSSYFLLMLWGRYGNLDLLKHVIPGWEGPGSDPDTRKKLIPGVPWDHELISFLSGFALLVLVPMGLIKAVFKQSLSEYGLGLPKRRWDFAVLSLLTLGGASLLPFIQGTRDPDMRKTYPLYRKLDPNNLGQFALYQLCYLPFFITIEFIYRGYLLFGLAGLRAEIEKHARMHSRSETAEAATRSRFFTRYALLIQMLSYTAWHLGKPSPELWGAFLWGPVAGATAYAGRSIWPVVVVHWALNIFLDGAIIGLRLRPSRLPVDLSHQELSGQTAS
jgi:Type II CAAX prenyl endopeptidase Rce1-like